MLLLEHFLDGTLQLSVVARKEILWTVIYDNVGVERSVFAECAVHVLTPNLRNAEDERTVHKHLPPYGSHSTCHWRSYEFSDTESLIYQWETVSIGVVVLANKYA